MNTEDFVTYEQALALKKLGFDDKVNHYYDNNGVIDEILADLSMEDPTGQYSAYDNCNDGSYNGWISAPTLAQVQKWLREKKDYHIEPRLFYDKFHTDCKSSSRGRYWQIEHGKYYSSYEEALSAGITECIKLLENN